MSEKLSQWSLSRSAFLAENEKALEEILMEDKLKIVAKQVIEEMEENLYNSMRISIDQGVLGGDWTVATTVSVAPSSPPPAPERIVGKLGVRKLQIE